MSWRRVTSWVLLVVTWLLLLGSVLAVWARAVLLDTDRFVATFQPVVRDERVLAAASERVSAAAVSALDVQGRVQASLAGPADDLVARTLTAAVGQGVDRLAERLLQAAPAQPVLEATVRATHARFVQIMRGESAALTVQDGGLTLDLQALIGKVLDDLQDAGVLPSGLRLPRVAPGEPPGPARSRLEAALGHRLPPDFGQVRLLDAPALEQAQRAVRALDALALVLPLLTVLGGAAAVLVAPRRRRAAIALGAGGAVTLLLAGVLLRALGPGIAAGATAAAEPLAQAVAQAGAETLGASLANTLWLVALGAALLAAVAYAVPSVAGARRPAAPPPATPPAAPPLP